jgi:VWFA-related protein
MRALRLRRVVACVLAALVGAPLLEPGRAYEQTPAQERPIFEVDTAAVLLDVVVRDKRNRALRDLAAGDFEVHEDGVRQEITSFRVFDAGTAPDPGGPGRQPTPPSTMAATGVPASPPAHPTPPAVIAFVFDRLSQAARAHAHKAAMAYVEGNSVAGDLASVFSIDLALRTLQPFTSDREAIEAALRRAATQAQTAFANDRGEARSREASVARADASLGGMGGASGADAGSSQARAAVIAAQQAFDQLQGRMLRTFDALERDQQGFATTNALLAIVNGLGALPGRKTIVLFSEGLSVTSGVNAQFRSVIAAANRANVSVYAVDGGGLRVESMTAEARQEIVDAAKARVEMEATGRYDRAGALSRTLERNEDLMRLGPEGGLAQLADETGGFLVRDTNDAREAFRRVAEDMRFHYFLSYTPANAAFDGRFRKVEVKVRRPGAEVQARKGYFAVRPAHALPVRTFEAAALAQLERSPRPEAFPLRAGALSFPEMDRPDLAPVLVELPASAVTWKPEGEAYKASFAVVVRLREANGREADRVGQDYVLTAPRDKLDAARKGNILFYREASLAPGRYTAEAVAYDSQADTASVRTATVEVPALEHGKLRLSSLVLVNRADQVAESERSTGNPLHYGETILYPSLGAPFRRSGPGGLGFYFRAYGLAPNGRSSATFEIRRGSQVLGTTNTPLPAADATGRAQHAGTFPITSLPPGAYTLKVSVSDGGSTATREATFDVVD